MTESEILNNVKILSDADLNLLIQAYLDGSFYFGSETTAAGFRTTEYSKLRKFAYPELSDKADAEVKINSGIPELVTEGQAQLAAYVQDCLNVKTRFPKE